MTIQPTTLYEWAHSMQGASGLDWRKFGLKLGRAEILRDLAIREGNVDWERMSIQVITWRNTYAGAFFTLIFLCLGLCFARAVRNRKAMRIVALLFVTDVCLMTASILLLRQSVSKVTTATELLLAQSR